MSPWGLIDFWSGERATVNGIDAFINAVNSNNRRNPRPTDPISECRQQARYLWVMDSLPPRTITDSAPTWWFCGMLQAAECLQTQLVLPKATWAGLCWAAQASFVATIKRFLIGVILLITSSVHLFLSQLNSSWWNRLVMIVGSQKWDRFYSLIAQNLNRLISFDWRFQTGLSTDDTILMGLHIHLSEPKFGKDPWRKMPSLPQLLICWSPVAVQHTREVEILIWEC